MRNLWLLSFILSPFLLFSQAYQLKGVVVDGGQVAVVGATVALQHPWGELVEGQVTDMQGYFAFKSVPRGGYKLKISFLGFEDFLKEVTLTDSDVDMGLLRLSSGAINLEEVKVEGKAPLATQKEDTVQFNANAFKVMKDADAGDLLSKMPSISVENGTVKAQGENVGQVLVDGKPFFGNDPNVALKSLPAEVVEKIQVFDAQSEQSQFTGFGDGNTTKTINIVTKSTMRTGQFGKLYGGYGYEDKYQAGGNINIFSGERRISLIGMTNNINIQNFSTEDILGVLGSSGGRSWGGGGGRSGGGRPGGGRYWGGGGSVSDFLVNPRGGIATTHAFGINYSDKWGKKIEVTGSYFFNKGVTNAEEALRRQFIAQDTPEVYFESNGSSSDNLNHRFNLRIEYELDSMNTLIFSPRLTLQENIGRVRTEGMTTQDTSLLSQTNNLTNTNLQGSNFSSSLLWRHKFGKTGRTFSVNLSGGLAPQIGDNSLDARSDFYSRTQQTTETRQISDLDARNWNGSVNLDYTEPITANGQLLFNYRLSYQEEQSDRYTFDYNEQSEVYDLRNDQLSNVFSNEYRTHQGGVGYSYRVGRDLFMMARVNAQWATLVNQQTFPYSGTFDQTFFNVLPFAMIRYNLSKEENFRLFYRSNTQLPSINQLQNVLDNSNPLLLKVGNPNLVQAAQHNLYLRYQKSNVDKASTFYAMIRAGLTNDYIANATYFADSDNPLLQDYPLQRGAQINRPVNLDGYWNMQSFVSFGLPLRFIKSNFNLDFSYNFSRTPGLIDDLRNFANSHSLGTGVTISSNISDKIDFSISTRPNWNQVENTLQADATEFLSLNSRANMAWIIWEGFVLRTDLSNQINSGLSESFNQQFWIWNLGVGKKVLKNDRGEITLAVNDLLKQNRNITRNTTETYIEDIQTNALQQFIMLSFTYNLRHFNLGKSENPTSVPGRMGSPHQ